MKITEVKNNLFGLEDLKGLIKENIAEAKPKAGAPSMSGFFELHPEFIGKTYRNCPELRSALYDYFQPTEEFPKVTPFPHPDEYETLPADIAKKYYTRVKNGMPQNLEKVRKTNRQFTFGAENVVGKPENVDKATTQKGTSIDLLKYLFNQNGGDNISYTPDINTNFNTLKNYVDNIHALVNPIGEMLISNYKTPTVNLGDFAVDETVPFSLFLLFFYHSVYCERRGVGPLKSEEYLGSIQNQNVSQYVKYLLNEKPNIFNTILNATQNELQGLSETLENTGYNTPLFQMSRAAAYFERYKQEYPGLFTDEFMTDIKSCFGFGTADDMFDPIGAISNGALNSGFREWCGNDGAAIKNLVKPPINRNQDTCSPIEKIFITANALDNLLSANYSRYGAGPAGAEMTIGLLLKDGQEAINEWNSLNPKNRKIPAPQIALQTLYNSEKMKGAKEMVPFWRLLNFSNELKDKTQGDIYYFLIGNSSPNVTWTYEYNRSKKIDNDLNGKSIDILGEAGNRTFCFEYQGEQHYRPLSVTYKEYSAFPFFTKMREYILTQCGFIEKTVGGTKFFSGPPEANSEKMEEIKQIILSAYKQFANELSASLNNNGKIISRLNETYKSLKGINKKSKFESDTQILLYFQRILEESKKTDVFENPPLQEAVPYVGSPRRFLDEVKTAQDMGRDMRKRDIIRKREKAGWVLSYIIPQRATEDEKEYTIELAGNKNLVFPWNKEGKEKLLGFLRQNDMLANGVLEEDTLFRQIVSELLNY